MIHTMKSQIKSIILHFFSLANIFPTIKTRKLILQRFINKLYPVNCDKELIRIGPEGDGGYLVPNDLDGIEACFSPGIGDESGFEKECANLGMEIFLADKSEPKLKHNSFDFTKKFVGAYKNDDFITLDSWINDKYPDDIPDLLLQMDIEGYEYEVLLSASDKTLRSFRIIVIEFHLFDQLFSRPFFKLASRVFDKILQSHTCVHIHPNNCCGAKTLNGITIPSVMEFTFYRNDRIEYKTFTDNYPNPLDYDNTAKKSIPLPKCWYKN